MSPHFFLTCFFFFKGTRRRGVAVLCSIGASSLAAAACDELFRPLLSRLPGGRKAANVKPPFDMAIELTSKLGKVCCLNCAL